MIFKMVVSAKSVKEQVIQMFKEMNSKNKANEIPINDFMIIGHPILIGRFGIKIGLLAGKIKNLSKK